MSQRNWYLFFVLLFLIFLLRLVTFDQPQFLSGTKIKITGILHQEPKIVGNLQKFSLVGLEIKTWKYPEYHYGDELVVTGVIKENSLEFPEISRACCFAIEKKEERKKGEVLAWINRLRLKIESIYHGTLPEPQASLLSGIVLGSKSGMPYDFYQALRQTGTLHIVVASGMNVSMLAGFLVSVLVLFISRKRAVLIAFFGIWFYALLAGFDPPIIRAGIMGSLAFMAQGLGRQKIAFWSLILAGISMLLLNPRLIFDLSFQLSFLSTGGILLFSSSFKRILKLPLIGENLTVTLSAQLATLPIMLFSFGWISLFSPLVNALVLWTVPWIMGLGGVVALFGLIFPPLGQQLAYFVLPFLVYFVKLVEVFG